MASVTVFSQFFQFDYSRTGLAITYFNEPQRREVQGRKKIGNLVAVRE